jgi:hypothetical protein
MSNPDKQADDLADRASVAGRDGFESITAGRMPMKKYKIAVLDDESLTRLLRYASDQLI